MTIYVDSIIDWPIEAVQPVARKCGTRWCHLISDASEEELHAFAQRIGLRRSWYQAGHYDLVPARRAAAVRAGAQEVERAGFVAAVRLARAAGISFTREERKLTAKKPETSQELVIPKVFVSGVTTNLKTPGENPRAFPLGPLTLIAGPSGSGKTSLVDAVCLALTGNSPTRGLGKSPANLKRALPERAEALTSAITLSLGETVTWSLGRNDSKPVWSAKEGFTLPGSGALLPSLGAVLSVKEVLDLLLGEDKKRALEILEAVPSTEIVVTGIGSALIGIDRELSIRLEGSLPTEGSTVSPAQLRQAVATVDSLASEYSKAAANCATFKSVGLSAAEQTELDGYEKSIAAQEGSAFVRDELTRVEKQITAAQTECAEFEKLIEADVPGYFQTQKILSQASALLKGTLDRMTARELASAKCPGCGESYSVERFTARREQLDAGLLQLDEKVQGYLESLEHHRASCARLVPRQAVLSDLLTTLGAGEAVNTARLGELRVRKNEAVLSLAASVRASTIARCSKILELVQAALLDSAAKAVPVAAETVCRRVNKVLPRGREVRIVCDGRKVQVGQSRDKGPVVPIGALSGSERVVLAAAFAVGVQSTRTVPVSLLVLDETMFDRNTLKTVLAGLSKAFDVDSGPTQIIACASEWTGTLPAGWVLVDLSEKKKEKGKSTEEKAEENGGTAEEKPLDLPGVEAAPEPQSAAPVVETPAKTEEKSAFLEDLHAVETTFVDDLL